MNDVAELPAQKTPKMPARMRRFCEEYSYDMNGKAAAIRAGYSPIGAKSIASTNLTRDDVKAYLTELYAETLNQIGVNRERVLTELARIGFSDIRNIFNDEGGLINPKDLDDKTAASISSVEVVAGKSFDDDPIEYTHKYKTWNKLDALKELGRHLGIGADEGVKVAVQVNISKADAAGF